MQPRFWLFLFVLLSACSSPAEKVDRKTQAATFPETSTWRPLTRFGIPIADVANDGDTGGRELVGSAAFPAAFIYADGLDFFVRMRLDADPSGTGADILAPYAWGVELELNSNLAAYEYLIIADGTVPGANAIVLAENTNQVVAGSTADQADQDLALAPVDIGVDGNLAISLADSSFNGDADYFLDFSIPMTDLVNAGLDFMDTPSLIIGTSDDGRSLSGDLMSCDGNAFACTITTSHTDGFFFDGTRADRDRDATNAAVDLDEDNDGILDTDENSLGVDPDADADNDGIPNWHDADDEGDGTSTCVPGNASGFCAFPGPRYNSDEDDIPNHLDVDSDNDGIVDLFECGHGAIDADGNGVVDGATGANGFVDELETAVDSGIATYVLLDTDGDGIQNSLDLDSDDDGIFDLDEIGGTALDLDDDGDADSSVDPERDGLMSTVDQNESVFGFPGIDPSGFDPDSDSIPDPYDADEDNGADSGDSDGDGGNDTAECSGTWPACNDGDSDGRPDYMRPGLCGDAFLDAVEGCDDGALANGDGCNDQCLVEDDDPCNANPPGFVGNPSCASGNCDLLGNAAPGVCEALDTCGNGILEAAEGCDDGNIVSNDGCSVTCLVEDDSACNDLLPGLQENASCEGGNCDLLGNAVPGVCEALNECGNGILEADEGCDDGNNAANDGCSAACLVENDGACNDSVPGLTDDSSCTSGNCDTLGNATPGICEPLGECGNGILETNEGCDDGGIVANDGCSAACLIEDDTACNDNTDGQRGDGSCASGNCDTLGNAAPGICEPLDTCGNSILETDEGCDDGNRDASDGCSAGCLVEDDNACNDAAPGRLDDSSCLNGNCDTLGNVAPGVCEPLGACGNGILDANEGCDDGNTLANDGCSTACLIEFGRPCNQDATGLIGDDSCQGVTCNMDAGAPGLCTGDDSDGDGVVDFVDLDDDNDGILDTADGADGSIDTDSDGVPDSLDLDTDNDGAADVIEAGHDQADASQDGQVDCATGFGDNGFCDALETTPESGIANYGQPVDTDADTIPDFQDLDTDADGISDLLEVDSGCADTTPADQRCDGADADADGIVDPLDGRDGFGDDEYGQPPDSDGDGVADFRELDADDDGLSDHFEGESQCLDANNDRLCDAADDDSDGLANDAGPAGSPDTDGDGKEDYRDIDSDNDGILDDVEEDVDTDGDGYPNYQDLDSDDDGIRDLVEGSCGCNDSDNDGRCDGPDGDNDGRADDATNDVPPDTDGDGAADYVDLDTDNDGLTDVFEGGSGCADASPLNAVCDGPDGDGDGLADDSTGTPPDSDGDGVDDFRDLDTDDDGLTDLDEGGSGCTDQNSNDVCDGPDSDGDGIADSIDDTDGHGDETPTIPRDEDGDTTPDAHDDDSDDDGNPDSDDSPCADTSPADGVCDDNDSDGDGIVDDADGSDDFGTGSDTDGDGRDDIDDLDDDNDGIVDTAEGDGIVDTDSDGTPDSLDLDSDNDSILDAFEAGHSLATGAGTVRCTDGFGNNGFCDALETSAESGVPDYDDDALEDAVSDRDADGIPDFRDLDTDGDTISDTIESGLDCTDQEAPTSVCDGGDIDRDGVVDGLDETVGFGAGALSDPVDTDTDGEADFRDVDSDDDSIHDIVEAIFDQLDMTGDGISNDSDADGDGISDVADAIDGFGGAPPARDTDDDGTPDFQDLDADGDQASDTDEAGPNPLAPVDTDGDGARDFQDVDSDADDVPDRDDNCRVDANSDQLDLDEDGVGTLCEEDFEFGVQGGGCSSSGAPSGPLALLLVALAMLAIRPKRRWLAPIALAIPLFISAPTLAQRLQLETDYPVERFRLASDPSGILDVEWASVSGHKVINLGLWMGWSDDPMNLYTQNDEGRERAGSLVSSRMAGNLIGSIGLAQWAQLGLEVPLILYQGQDVGDFMNTGSAPTSYGMGDLRLVPKLGLLKQKKVGVNVGVTLGVTLPTSTSDDYFGEATAFIPELLLSRSFESGLRVAANLGMVARKKVTVADLVVDDELQAKIGLGYRLAQQSAHPVEVDLSYALATGLDDPLGAFNRNYSELRMGGTYKINSVLTALSAVGLGVAEGFGTPDWRVLAGLRFHKDVAAPEPAKPAAFVPVDSDGDGIFDHQDPCPQRAENLNGYRDADGCPDEIPDTDNDGLDDQVDQCPHEPEDVDGVEDEDGCPDPDNDKDGFLDTEDECPDIAGIKVLNGCPDTDRDGDRVVDRLDNCPDVPGDIDNSGCIKRQLVKITDSSIEILDIVYFRTNKAIIRARSFPMLDNVATVMMGHSEIPTFRIEGHTDSRDSAQHNKTLSQDRADAVVQYLIGRGVDASRLQAIGHGEDVPIADNATKEGRAANRRVEFNIVGDSAGVNEQRTGPTEDTIDE